MPNNKTDNKTVEITMDTLDIQTNVINTGIAFKFLATKKMDTVRINFSKYWMKSNLDMFFN